jgi:hypothetical protein
MLREKKDKTIPQPPKVRKTLGQHPGVRSAFNPLDMPGEPLSQTVLRERR